LRDADGAFGLDYLHEHHSAIYHINRITPYLPAMCDTNPGPVSLVAGKQSIGHLTFPQNLS